MKNFAPVLIPTLNRYTHFKSCIESLLKCTDANKTDIVIALDFPKYDSHWDGYVKIKQYIERIDGFNKLIIIERTKNFGPIDNFFMSVEYVLNRYDTIIFSEDDNVFSPDFLSYINKGLAVYKERKDIFSINGYNFPVTLPPSYMKDVYLYQGFSAWGYGTWKDRWENISWNIDELRDSLNSKEDLRNTLSANLLKGLDYIIKTGHINGDTYICYYQSIHNMYSVFPVISRVRNNGHDGSGIHGGNNKRVRNIYLNQKISNGTLIVDLPIDLEIDFDVQESLRKHFNVYLFKKILYNPHIVFRKMRFFLKSLIRFTI